MARDGSLYVGVEAGPMFTSDADLDYQGLTGTNDGSLSVDHKMGLDVDGVVGYDFGFIRVEGELGYKRARISDTDLSANLLPSLGDG